MSFSQVRGQLEANQYVLCAHEKEVWERREDELIASISLDTFIAKEKEVKYFVGHQEKCKWQDGLADEANCGHVGFGEKAFGITFVVLSLSLSLSLSLLYTYRPLSSFFSLLISRLFRLFSSLSNSLLSHYYLRTSSKQFGRSLLDLLKNKVRMQERVAKAKQKSTRRYLGSKEKKIKARE